METRPDDNPFLALFEPLQPSISTPRPKPVSPPRDLSNDESTKALQRINTLIGKSNF